MRLKGIVNITSYRNLGAGLIDGIRNHSLITIKGFQWALKAITL